MLELAKNLNCEKQMILGYRDGNLFLRDEFEAYGEVFVATEDGSSGTKGNVLDAIRENGLDAEIIYACGPAPMLRALKHMPRKRIFHAIYLWKNGCLRHRRLSCMRMPVQGSGWPQPCA